MGQDNLGEYKYWFVVYIGWNCLFAWIDILKIENTTGNGKTYQVVYRRHEHWILYKRT